MVVGHHVLDYLETVLINLIRGGGSAAFETMPIYNGEVFRPLMLFSIRELQNILEEENWKIFEDESNQSNDYLRNRIRINVIPHLIKEGLNPYKLYYNFHSLDDVYSIGYLNRPQYLKVFLPQKIFPLECKWILDGYLKVLGCHPLTKKVLMELYKRVNEQRSFQVENSELIIWRGAKGSLYLLKKNTSLFEEPKQNVRSLTWNTKTILLEENETLLHTWKGRKIKTKIGNKEISEIFREKNIPAPIRKFIPVTEKENQVYKIYFHLWDEQMQDFKRETL